MTTYLQAAQTRRHFLCKASIEVTFFAAPGAFAEELTRQTTWVTQGPLYPDRFPLNTDTDLIIVSKSITPAVGEITHLSGRLLRPKGEPINNAVIEIWPVDSKAVYLRERGQKRTRIGELTAKFDILLGLTPGSSSTC